LLHLCSINILKNASIEAHQKVVIRALNRPKITVERGIPYKYIFVHFLREVVIISEVLFTIRSLFQIVGAT